MRSRRHAAAEGTPSPAIREYMEKRISSNEYFKRVREETAKEVDRELRERPERVDEED